MSGSLGGGAYLHAVPTAGQGVSEGSPLGQTGLALCCSSVPGGGAANFLLPPYSQHLFRGSFMIPFI